MISSKVGSIERLGRIHKSYVQSMRATGTCRAVGDRRVQSVHHAVLVIVLASSSARVLCAVFQGQELCDWQRHRAEVVCAHSPACCRPLASDSRPLRGL